MESIQQVKYSKDTEVHVHYPDFIWVCIASVLFGGICWYIGYIAALSDWFEDSPLILSYLFYVLIVAIALFYTRTIIKLLDRKKSWLHNFGDRLGAQFFFCVLLPTIFLFAIIRPVAAPKSEWIWLPLLVILGGMLFFNMGYAIFFYSSVYRKRETYVRELEKRVGHLEQKLSEQEGQLALWSNNRLVGEEEPSKTDENEKEGDTTEDIDLALLKGMDTLEEEFLLNNRYLTKKIMYNELGIFLFEKTNNTPIVKLFLKGNMEDGIGCEQRSLNEVVRDTNGFVQKIDRYHAIPLDMVKSCYQLKGGRLRIILHVPFGDTDSFVVSSTISRRIKDWVMLQVPIEKDNSTNQ
ncbi:MAG: hypothetical protein K0S24_1981 [Sphingobacterium sp.]|jgi:hypothetical protein|nr:hypothetical protein [Sphingobacterium sp.]